MRTPPKDAEQFERRFAANSKVDGFGADIKTHIPCPFCAHPGFNVVPILSTEEALTSESTCAACGRSGKNVMTEDAEGKAFEFVQTGGPDPDPWQIEAQGAPRRVDGTEPA